MGEEHAMAAKVDTRDAVNLTLAAIMAIGLAVAIIGGLVAIVRFGRPDAPMATLVAETGAWTFAGAFFVSFFLALRDMVKPRHSEV
jgi:hypothetical protein